MKQRYILLVAAVTMATWPATTAFATPASGFTAVQQWKGDSGPIELKAKGAGDWEVELKAEGQSDLADYRA